MLGERDELRLTPAQVRALTAIDRRWQRETAPLRDTLEKSAADFRARMGERGGKAGTLQDLQVQTAAVSEYSRQLHALRRTVWLEAAERLSARQREQAEALWHEQMSGRARLKL